MISTKLPGQLVLTEINNLAATLFAMHGQRVAEGVKFYAATCELGRQCWNAAVITYFNTVIRNSDAQVSDYLLDELTPLGEIGTSIKQPLVTY